MVCLCNAVAERQVRAAIDHGASDVDQVIAACGAGGNCTGCHPTIERLLEQRVTVRRVLATESAA